MNATLSRWSVALILSAPLLGCAKEDVSSYSAPNDADPGTGSVRVLAAIIPVNEDTYFIKLTGRNDIVEAVEPEFRQMILKLEFPEVKKAGDPSLKWETPKGWKEDRTKPNREATFTPPGMSKPEITITKLGEMAAAVKPNVDRWRRLDLGLPSITPRALERVASEQEVRGRTLTVVDMRGPGGKGMTPTFAGHPPTQKEKRPVGKSPLKYKVPEGWKDVGGTSSLVVAALSVTDGNESARLTVTPLNGSMPGGLTGNVNRWRQEVGLQSLGAAEVDKMKFPTIRVGGDDAKMLDLEGKTDRSLVVWFERGGTSWFFKMRGPTKLVGSQKAKFEEFMKSVQFPGGAE